MIVAGEARQVPLFSRSELCTGQEIIGPAIVTEPTSTIIIDPDPANVRAVRAYEKAGFVPIPELVGRTGDDVLIMQHHLKAIE